jgi:DNA polymerase III subunit alpha
LEGLVPLRKDANGASVLEYDKIEAEDNGLIKIDTLGLETLDIINDTYKLIKEAGIEIDDDFNYESNDPETYKLISDGDTFGVFQLASTAVHVCKKVQPKNIDDIALITALVRPAAKDTIPALLKVRDGDDEMNLIHPSLERAFAGTYGFGLFEESLMYLALDMAAWDLHEADKLRKLTKLKGKSPELVEQWHNEFIEGAVKNNIPKEIADKTWIETVNGFNGYGFNKCLSGTVIVGVYSKDGGFIENKQIKDIVSGEYIRSRDEKTGETIFVEVIEKHNNGEQNLVEVELETGETVQCTMNHKFRVKETGEMRPLYDIIEDGLSIVIG